MSFKNPNFGTTNMTTARLKSRKAFVEGIRLQIEEDDERMVDFDVHKTSTFRRRNSPIPGSARNNRGKGLVENGAGWYQVTVSTSTVLRNVPMKNAFVQYFFWFSLYVASVRTKIR